MSSLPFKTSMQRRLRLAGADTLLLSKYTQLLDSSSKGNTYIEITDAERSSLLSSSLVSEDSKDTPFILSGTKLQLQKRYVQEKEIAQHICDRLRRPFLTPEQLPILTPFLNTLFSDSKDSEEAKAAILRSLSHTFGIITGGPGTGKTYIVTRLLAAYIHLFPKARVALAAPTGKAAARLVESIEKNRSDLRVEDSLKDAFPSDATTLHRLLGLGGNRLSPRYHRHSQLPYDLIVIDEASMLDLSLIQRLLEATSAQTNLILLGDQFQLASVQAGSVFSDVCTVLKQSQQKPISELTKTYRFPMDKGLGIFAQSCRMNDEHSLISSLHKDETLTVSALTPGKLTEFIRSKRPHYRALSTIKETQLLFQHLKTLQLITVSNRGSLGAQTINEWMEKELGGQKGIFYSGKPIIITQNDYALGVFNGDIGICVFHQNKQMVVFEDKNNTYFYVPYSQLTHFDTAYAITIHKSQGSEYTHVVVVLPPEEGTSEGLQELLTKEMIYTAVTRTKSHCTIFGSENQIISMTRTPTQRLTRLKEWLTMECSTEL